MKVFLCNVPWYEAGEKGFFGVRAGSRWPHKWPFEPSMKIGYRPFPFFMATASAVLKREGIETVFRDSIEAGDTYERFYNIVSEEKPDLFLMETSTPSLGVDLKVAEHVNSLLPNCKIVFTGLHVEVAQTEFLDKYPFISFTIYGEYELPLLQLVKVLRDGGKLSDVHALVYRDESGKAHKNERGPLAQMSELPWPDRDSIPTDYYDGMNGLPEPQLQMHTSRGCPYHCNFCVWPQLVYGSHQYRMREPQDIIDEILANLKKVDYRSIYFDDDAININKEHLLELCKLIKKNGLDRIRWGCMARADLMDDELLTALKESGCYSVKYGVETFNQEILDRTGKSMDIKKNVAMVKKTREEYGLKVHLTYCLGLLGDTEETVKDTIEKALELDADSRQFSIATPYPGSKLWDIYKEKGWIATDNFDMFDGHNTAVTMQEGISSERLSELREYAERKDAEQQALRVPLEFLIKEKRERISSTVGADKNILITCTTRRGIVSELYRLLSERNKVHVLVSEEFSSSLSSVAEEHKLVLPKGSRISKQTLKQYVDTCKKDLGVDYIVIPTRGDGKCGYENVEEAVRGISNRIVRIDERANITIL